jgi:hypothetical protein
LPDGQATHEPLKAPHLVGVLPVCDNPRKRWGGFMSEHAFRLRGRWALVVASAMATIVLVSAARADARTLRERNTGVAALAQAPLQFGKWTEFDVGATGSVSNIFTFRSAVPVLLRVTDAFCRGDQFTVLDRGVAVFDTSNVGTDPSCDDTPSAETGPVAWGDQSYSKGKILLEPGRHRVKVKITDSPFGGATGFLRIDRKPAK